MGDLQSLIDQILSRYGKTGEWNMAGVDRASELAQLLQQSGITNLDDLKLEKTQETYVPTLNEWNEMNVDPNYTKTRDGYQLVAGDKRLGYLGNVGDGKDSAKSFLEQVDGKPGETTYRLGGSAAGDGWTSFDLTPGADGQFSITPKWGSSSNADEFMKAATAIAAPVAAWGMGLGVPALGEAAGAAGAAGGASDIALMADLGAKTLTPWDWASAALMNGELGYAAAAASPALGFAPGTTFGLGGAAAGGAGAAGAGGTAAGGAGAAAGAGGAAAGNGLLKLATAALGAAAGSQKSDDTTATNTRSMDPRIDQRVFGAGGLLELADKQLAANPTGQNDTMRRGQEMLRGIINDPGVGQGLVGMANRGIGMMNSPIAGNPFLNWKFPGV